MPVPPAVNGRSTSSFSRLTSFPAFLAAASPPSASTATPAESYPRYSSRFSPAITTSSADCDPTYPTIPHMRGSLGVIGRRNTALRARFRILRRGGGRADSIHSAPTVLTDSPGMDHDRGKELPALIRRWSDPVQRSYVSYSLYLCR